VKIGNAVLVLWKLVPGTKRLKTFVEFYRICIGSGLERKRRNKLFEREQKLFFVLTLFWGWASHIKLWVTQPLVKYGLHFSGWLCWPGGEVSKRTLRFG
jgi:hypothetical protein